MFRPPAWIGNQIGNLRVQTAEKTDVRLRLMNEIVNGMKVIKMYTWEDAFSTLVQDIRKYVKSSANLNTVIHLPCSPEQDSCF
jgi:ATP-binding cassette subfamily C (CFTR/MRP) protein 4